MPRGMLDFGMLAQRRNAAHTTFRRPLLAHKLQHSGKYIGICLPCTSQLVRRSLCHGDEVGKSQSRFAGKPEAASRQLVQQLPCRVQAIFKENTVLRHQLAQHGFKPQQDPLHRRQQAAVAGHMAHHSLQRAYLNQSTGRLTGLWCAQSPQSTGYPGLLRSLQRIGRIRSPAWLQPRILHRRDRGRLGRRPTCQHGVRQRLGHGAARIINPAQI